jgi:peptidoglycan hydrolase CwlO-like protein
LRHRPTTVSRVNRARRQVTTLLTVLVATGVPAFALVPAAGAQTTTGSSADAATPSSQLRVEADTLSRQYFATLASFAQADAAVRDNETAVSALHDRAAKAKAAARERAVIAYKSSGSGLTALIESRDTVDTAHRVRLIDEVNARDRSTYRSLHNAMRALKAKQQALRDARQTQEQALADLKQQGAALDAKLAEAQQQERAAAATAQTATQAQQPQQTQQTQAAAAATTTAPPTTRPPVRAPTPPPDYTGTPGTSPHHDDPFLTCLRTRESGGNYSAVNTSGPYLGAYQFLQATWNGAAAHAGRSDLVGVPANFATPFDQDEVAWSLYQWQGAAPWGGHCP